MEENVVAEDSASPSIQQKRETNVNENTSNDEIVVPNNVFCNLIDNLEGFGKHMEKVCKKFEEKIISQSQLIESLSARIDYLELDSKVKDQDIKRLRASILATPARVTTNKSNEMECKICRKKFRNLTKFKNHAHYGCANCKMVFASKKKRRRHMRKNHKNYAKHPDETSIHEIILYQSPSSKTSLYQSYQLKCKICKEIFNSHLLFNNHAKNSHGYKFSCLYCSKVFSEKRLHRKHVKKAYTCKVCAKKVIGEGGLINHCKAKNHQLNIEEIVFEGVQISTQEESKLEIAENNGSFDDNYTEEENEESDDDDDDTEEENDESNDDDDDTEDENEESDNDDDTEDENEESDNDDYTEEEDKGSSSHLGLH